MMIIFWLSVITTGIIFNLLGLPAPWLLGPLAVGMVFSLSGSTLRLDQRVFTAAQAFIGVSLGSMLDIGLVREAVFSYFFTILLAVVATLLSGWLLGYLLYKRTDVDFRTAIYSFIPGGASEVLGVAQSQGTDIRVVAAFHSMRIILYLSIIPLLVGAGSGSSASAQLYAELLMIGETIIPIAVVVIAAIVLSRFLPIPAGTLFFSTALMVVWALFDSGVEIPLMVAGIGQMLIGANIGLRFDINAISMLWRLKFTGGVLLFGLIVSTLIIAGVFSVSTEIDIWSSILGWVPAGAGEMASTAIFLELDESSVISLQMIRLYAVFLTLPLMMKVIEAAGKKVK